MNNYSTPEENQILINDNNNSNYNSNSNLVYSLPNNNNEITNNYWTVDEDNIIINISIIYGNKWKLISKHLPNRTTTAIRNRWQRIERAQKLKNGKTIKFGGKRNRTFDKLTNKCTKCGEFKRGHTCIF